MCRDHPFVAAIIATTTPRYVCATFTSTSSIRRGSATAKGLWTLPDGEKWGQWESVTLGTCGVDHSLSSGLQKAPWKVLGPAHDCKSFSNTILATYRDSEYSMQSRYLVQTPTAWDMRAYIQENNVQSKLQGDSSHVGGENPRDTCLNAVRSPRASLTWHI